MIEETKKKLVIIVFVFIGLGIIALLLSTIFKNQSDQQILAFNDDEKTFSIQSTINNEINLENTIYTINKIIYKTYNNTDYLFINGYTIYFPELGNAEYKDNINYLLILKGNTYNLYLLNENNIDEYAKDYDEYKQLENGKVLNIINYSEKNKLSNYISNFINLINFDTLKSYYLLSEKEKNSIGSYTEYRQNIDKYLNLSSNIISYEKKDNIYYIIDSNNNKFKIIENSTMDYKIEF